MNKRIIWAFLAIATWILLLGIFAIAKDFSLLTQYAKECASLPVALGLLFANIWCYCKTERTWQGVYLFALSWAIFPLLKVINHALIAWHADEWLTQLDQFSWQGKILPAYFSYENHEILTDILASCYFCFYVLVIGSVVLYANKRRTQMAQLFFNGLLLIYVVGYVGYLSLPAAGPAFYSLPDTGTGGGVIGRQLINIVKQGVTGMDVFPSLHTALSLFITAFLWRDGYHKIALVLLPISTGIVIATIFLRYHYGIDVLSGMLLAGVAFYYSRASQP